MSRSAVRSRQSQPSVPSRDRIATDNWQTVKDRVRIARAENDLLFDETNRRFIDLFSGNGTAWMGHANGRISARVASQLDLIWITGGLETSVHREALAAIERFVPPSHAVAALYSTGMEASEFAIRMARAITGKPGVVGFEKSMHGKSLATAFLGWDNRDSVELPQFHRLAFVPARAEPEIIERLELTLRRHPISAVFIEPLQASGGGHFASDAFYCEVARLCGQYGGLLVFDEILTGFYRTGSAFYFSRLPFSPDVLLVGKAIGNGFPVSAVVAKREYSVAPKMLPGSTYAGNPLAAAAIVATLAEIDRVPVAEKVAAIEHTIVEAFAPLSRLGMMPRGRGALWIVELPPEVDAQRVALSLYEHGVFASYTGRILRILPAATIVPDHLSTACRIAREVLEKAYEARGA
jgi:acetylornithine/succinyldiaminopimelate/putrescine aminotransferase